MFTDVDLSQIDCHMCEFLPQGFEKDFLNQSVYL